MSLDQGKTLDEFLEDITYDKGYTWPEKVKATRFSLARIVKEIQAMAESTRIADDTCNTTSVNEFVSIVNIAEKTEFQKELFISLWKDRSEQRYESTMFVATTRYSAHLLPVMEEVVGLRSTGPAYPGPEVHRAFLLNNAWEGALIRCNWGRDLFFKNEEEEEEVLEWCIRLCIAHRWEAVEAICNESGRCDDASKGLIAHAIALINPVFSRFDIEDIVGPLEEMDGPRWSFIALGCAAKMIRMIIPSSPSHLLSTSSEYFTELRGGIGYGMTEQFLSGYGLADRAQLNPWNILYVVRQMSVDQTIDRVHEWAQLCASNQEIPKGQYTKPQEVPMEGETLNAFISLYYLALWNWDQPPQTFNYFTGMLKDTHTIEDDNALCSLYLQLGTELGSSSGSQMRKHIRDFEKALGSSFIPDEKGVRSRIQAVQPHIRDLDPICTTNDLTSSVMQGLDEAGDDHCPSILLLPLATSQIMMQQLPTIITLQLLKNDSSIIGLHPFPLLKEATQKNHTALRSILVHWGAIQRTYALIQHRNVKRLPKLLCRYYTQNMCIPKSQPLPPFTLGSFALLQTYCRDDNILKDIIPTYRLCVHLQRLLYPHLPAVPDDGATSRRPKEEQSMVEIYMSLWYTPKSAGITMCHLLGTTPLAPDAPKSAPYDFERVRRYRRIAHVMETQGATDADDIQTDHVEVLHWFHRRKEERDKLK